MRSAEAAASCPRADEAARALLAAGGSAVDAVVGAFFATAGAEPGGLLGPVVAMVAGVGAGVRTIDGRCLQPGRGTRRPRGLQADEPIPEAAWAAVPRSIPALLLLHAYGGTLPVAELLRPGVKLARALGSGPRAMLLETVARRGAAVMQSPEVSRAVLAHAGTAGGGLLTSDDLAEARPGDVAATSSAWGAGHQLAMPSVEAEAAHAAPHRSTEVAVAADQSGLVAAIAYGHDADGLLIPELGVRLPRGTAPVRRSVPRIRPATVLPAAAPIGILTRPADGWFAALAAAGLSRLHVGEAPSAGESLRALLERLVAGEPARQAVAASVQRRRASVVRLASQA